MYDEAEQLAESNRREAVELREQDRERHYTPKVVGYCDPAAAARQIAHDSEIVQNLSDAMKTLHAQMDGRAFDAIAARVFDKLPASASELAKTFREEASKDFISQARAKRQRERDERREIEFQQRFPTGQPV